MRYAMPMNRTERNFATENMEAGTEEESKWGPSKSAVVVFAVVCAAIKKATKTDRCMAKREASRTTPT